VTLRALFHFAPARDAIRGNLHSACGGGEDTPNMIPQRMFAQVFHTDGTVTRPPGGWPSSFSFLGPHYTRHSYRAMTELAPCQACLKVLTWLQIEETEL